MKRILCLMLACLLLCGCAATGVKTERKIYEATFLTLFDTVTVIKGAADSKEAFSEIAYSIHDELLEYHQLFDIYNDYAGIHNLKTVNDMAGKEPVTVDRRIIDLLKDCKTYYELTDGLVNVAMGSVLNLWHNARNDGINDPVNAKLPDMDRLISASQHMDLNAVVIDDVNSTVFITESNVQLDVGAVAKGYAAQQAAIAAAEAGGENFALSAGGNVVVWGDVDGRPWTVGIRDPRSDDPNAYITTVEASYTSLVTSGGYERNLVVDGKEYCHIIDPQTGYPADYVLSATAIHFNSDEADLSSTAMFLMTPEEAMAFAEKYKFRAIIVDRGGNLHDFGPIE
jgi:thiamine biosynthesis lipoprotein